MQLKYETVFRELQSKILSGYWPENAMIPTEFELCEEYNVSRITVRRALEELVRTGLIRRSRGKGSFVCSTKHLSETRNAATDNLYDSILTNIKNQIIEDKYYGPNTSLAKNMPLLLNNVDEGIVRIRLLELVDEVPHSLKSVFVSESTSKLLDREDLANKPFLEVYEKSTNNKIISMRRTISAIIPDDYHCNLLGVKRGTAHLWMKNTAFIEDRVPVATSYTIINGNLFDFVVDLHLKK